MTNMRKKVIWIVTLVMAIMLASTLFMPFASANEENRSYLLKYPDYQELDDLKFTNKDLTDISLYEYGQVYHYMSTHDIHKTISKACVIIIVAFFFSTMIELLLAALKKPIGVMVFDVITISIFMLIKYDFSDRGVVPGNSYNLGIANYLVFIFGGAVFIGAILLLIEKIREKKLYKKENVEG